MARGSIHERHGPVSRKLLAVSFLRPLVARLFDSDRVWVPGAPSAPKVDEAPPIGHVAELGPSFGEGAALLAKMRGEAGLDENQES